MYVSLSSYQFGAHCWSPIWMSLTPQLVGCSFRSLVISVNIFATAYCCCHMLLTQLPPVLLQYLSVSLHKADGSRCHAVSSLQCLQNVDRYDYPFDVEYIYGFVWWGVCKQSRWRHSVTEPSQGGGYVLLWQRYDNNKMVAMRYYSTSSIVQS